MLLDLQAFVPFELIHVTDVLYVIQQLADSCSVASADHEWHEEWHKEDREEGSQQGRGRQEEGLVQLLS